MSYLYLAVTVYAVRGNLAKAMQGDRQAYRNLVMVRPSSRSHFDLSLCLPAGRQEVAKAGFPEKTCCFVPTYCR